MRIAYLDCFAGISGDMFLGALIDAGVPVSVMQEATRALKLGASLKIEKVDRSGISSVKVHVLEGDKLADGGLADDASFEHQGSESGRAHLPKTQHLHKTGHAHDHPHPHSHGDEEHAHGRSLTVIRALIESADLAEPVKRTAVRTFELLGGSEAKIHNVPIEQIHFHEVGAVDAIVDIVAASAGIHHLEIGAWHSSPVNVGGGMVQCAHGLFPVPAPATADLLRGFPTYSAQIEKELVTPTGAALLRALAPEFGPQPAMVVERIGYGAGTRNPKDFPNVLRLAVGETSDAKDLQTISVIETALDDLSPQVIAYVAEQILAAGALDVMLTPVVMKKGRPGTLLTVLTTPEKSGELAGLILRETTTLGVRIREEKRVCLERKHIPMATEFGEIRMKIGFSGADEWNAAPEFEDCKAAASHHGVALKTVQAAAVAAYRGRSTK
jgi:uncharacterized protein (TIGR00299 family) protein